MLACVTMHRNERNRLAGKIVEMAQRADNSLAQQRLDSATDGLRMDAVMYCLGALERVA
jgi:hypothetical protein